MKGATGVSHELARLARMDLLCFTPLTGSRGPAVAPLSARSLVRPGA